MRKKFLTKERLIHPDPRFLFYLTAVWIALAFGVSGVLNWMGPSAAKTVLVVLISSFFTLFGLYVLCGFIRLMILWYLSARKVYPTLKDKYRLMRHDLLLRNQVLASFTSFYSFLNLVINFVTSFLHDRLFYYSIALIYAFIFFMKLYLLCFEDTKKHRRFIVLGILMLFTVASMLTVVTLYRLSEDNFTAKGAIIYWNAFYTFFVLITTVRNVFRLKKTEGDRYTLEMFLDVKLVNTLYSLFVLAAVMLLTFAPNGSEDERAAFRYRNMSVGYLFAAIIFFIALHLFVLRHKLLKSEKEAVLSAPAGSEKAENPSLKK